ncbi:MAG: YkgJ family cysteine cluster protein [Desulfobulbaceae bacterium]|nr:YkgJ family cysteine cluster protein [Desulfobulbaceae bacterium]HIJ78411.1 YkgJ family cysteine cluster protein [Deltaproteobacteria bacterium]
MAEYDALEQRLSTHISELSKILSAGLHCTAGCTDCCMAFSILAVEADRISKAFKKLPEPTRRQIAGQAKKDTEKCPLLIDGLCTVYAQRPIICRTHGLPLAYINEEQQAIEVSVCPLNFSPEYQFSREELLFMDEFNAELFLLNLNYCEEHGLDPETRIEIRTLVQEAAEAIKA